LAKFGDINDEKTRNRDNCLVGQVMTNAGVSSGGLRAGEAGEAGTETGATAVIRPFDLTEATDWFVSW
jgi:hypothetical protein